MLRKKTWDPVTDRMLDELHPYIRVKASLAIQKMEDAEIFVRIYCGYRDPADQLEKWKKGRDAKGNVIDRKAIVTFAKPFQSMHQYSLAFDCVEIRRGKAVWENPQERWEQIAQYFKNEGFDWAGEWMHFKEKVHFQMTYGYTWGQLKMMHDKGQYDRDGFLILKKMYL